MATKKPIVIDIFAGCGGLSLGLYYAGWKGLFAIEKSEMAFETLRHNLITKKKHFSWPAWLPIAHHDIDEVIDNHRASLTSLRGTIDLVAGGPPCQGFSTAGKREESDERNQLIHSYVKFVELVKPRTIFFENVQGFVMGFKSGETTGKPYSQVVLSGLKELGYTDVRGELLDFSEFGIPQRRNRFIIVGTLQGRADKCFELLRKNRSKLLLKKGLKTRIGVMAAISDLERSHGDVDSSDSKGFKAGVYSIPRNNYQRFLRRSMRQKVGPDSHRFVNHAESTVTIFQRLLKSGKRNVKICEEERERFGLKKRNTVILGRMSPSPTLMSIPDDYIHYAEPRILTVREYARIQSFPDWFEFRGAYTTGGRRRAKQVPRYTQVGNAIPPLFGEQMGIVLKDLLYGREA
jgi:DNA (cytosine-5)-methyltransferase 1